MKLAIFYDGSCQLCSREMRYYFRIRGARERIEFVDISDPGFDARAAGLEPSAIQKWMHVRLPSGQIRVGVDAFVALWRAVPGFEWLARLAESRLLKPLFVLGYKAFATVRPLLPKRKTSCKLSY